MKRRQNALESCGGATYTQWSSKPVPELGAAPIGRLASGWEDALAPHRGREGWSKFSRNLGSYSPTSGRIGIHVCGTE